MAPPSMQITAGPHSGPTNSRDPHVTSSAGGHIGQDGGRQHTTRPFVTGASVIGMRCADGVVLASDTMGM